MSRPHSGREHPSATAFRVRRRSSLGNGALLVLSAVYVAAGDTVVVTALFAGLAPAVLAIVTQAVVRVAGRAWATRLGSRGRGRVRRHVSVRRHDRRRAGGRVRGTRRLHILDACR